MAETLTEPEVSEFVQGFLEPIPGDSSAGTDIANDEDYFKLSMEFPKTVPDYKNWIDLSNTILKEKSKDIKVASWLCFALYRTEQLKGFSNGLEIVYHLLKKFGSDLFPQNNLHKGKAIQFLSTSRVTKLIERDEINKSNAAEIIKINELTGLILKECEKLMPENIPVLQALQDVIGGQLKDAESALNPSSAPEKKPVSPSPPKTEVIQASMTAAVKEESAPAKQLTPASEDEISIQLRRTLTHLYEVTVNNETVEKVPESFFAFGIARQIQWSTLVLPDSEEKITGIAPPNDIIRKLLITWHNEGKTDVLIPRIELEFIKDSSEFRYWLDAQRYLVDALEKKGGNYLTAANDIKYHLARLLKRLPELPKLKFAGEEIAFADKETVKWLEQLSANSNQGGAPAAGTTLSLTPIVDQVYDEINKEYEEALQGLPKNFQESLELMQQKLSAEDRMKGKFLRRLNIANFCYEAKQYNVAKVSLEELDKTIDNLNLSEWEPALCTASWQSLYLTNVQVLFASENETQKNQIEKQQQELFYKIAKHNGILAINLEQQKHKRRK